MVSDSDSASRNANRLLWALAVVGVMALALFLRVYWNLEPAVGEDGFRLSGGSDPYYHKRAIDHIQETWTTLLRDPMLNYPYGAVNPNPPLFQWSVAASGLLMSPFFGGDLATATWWAMLFNPAVMGALTVIPIYVIGTELFGRRAGLLAGVFWALSTSSFDHTSLGASDHDAFYMFFLVLGFAFFLKAIHRFRTDPAWVSRWSDGASVARGLKAFARERKVALAYAALAGVSLSAVALTWKGFPYATGIIFAYAGLQMVVDHWRNRDSLGIWAASLLATGVPVLLALPYYAAADVMNFLLPATYLWVGVLVAGVVLVPTRDMPSLLVLPGAALVAAIGVALTFVVPALEFVRVQLLYASVYFRRSKLYETIGEARPASFDDIVFGIGPIVFLVGLVALGVLLLTARKNPRRDTLFTFVWGVVAIYMAQAAVRFLFNAVPIFAILGGWLIALAIQWFDFGAYARHAHAGGFWSGFKRAFSVWHVVGVLFVALLLVMPSVLLAVDAAVPAEVERRIIDESGADSATAEFVDKRLGAFSQGFLADYWRDGLTWLDAHDSDVPPAERGAFLSWWDYGHWAIEVGEHPATADNFQNGYVHAGNFITALNETHAVQLLAARYVERDLVAPADAKRMLAASGAEDADATYDRLKAFEYAPDLDLEESVAFLLQLEQATGKKIRYFAVDGRMLPYDSPRTPYIDLPTNIFFAPVFLSGKDIDDYVETQYTGNDGRTYSREEAEARVQQASITQDGFQITGERYVYKQAFFDSMFWRAYAGSPPRGAGPTFQGDQLDEGLAIPQPAWAMKHFRLVYINDNLRILEFYPGATVSGTVTQDGEPVAGAVVSVLDDAGDLILPHASANPDVVASQIDVPHDQAVTDAEGRFELTAPFGMSRGVTLVATLDGVEIGRRTIEVTREQAQAGEDLGDVASFSVEFGSVEGRVYRDEAGDGVFNATEDELAAGVNLTIAGRNVTTGADGTYRIDEVAPGFHRVEVDADGWSARPGNQTVRIRPNETASFDVPLVLQPVFASGAIGVDADGDGAMAESEKIVGFPWNLEADPEVANNTATTVGGATAQAGAWNATLMPGAYVFRANYTDAEGRAFSIEDRFTVEPGVETFGRNFLLRPVEG